RAWFASCSSRGSSWPRGSFVGIRISTWGSVNARKPRSCNNRLPTGRGIAQKEDREAGIDEQDVFDGVILFLPALTVRLFNRVLGADYAPFRPVMGKRGASGVTAGTVAPGAGSSARGTTTVA